MEGLSNSDVALLADRNDGMFGGAGGSWMWFLNARRTDGHSVGPPSSPFNCRRIRR